MRHPTVNTLKHLFPYMLHVCSQANTRMKIAVCSIRVHIKEFYRPSVIRANTNNLLRMCQVAILGEEFTACMYLFK